MHSVVVTQPSCEPITMQQVKDQLNIDRAYDGDDSLLSGYITAARIWMEQRIGQSLISQARKQYMDCFPSSHIEILYGPLILSSGSPVSFAVKYYDQNDAEQTWAADNYWVTTTGYTHKIVPKYSWPSAGERPNAVWVEYTAGHGTAPTDVKSNIRQAMLLIVANMYTNRSPEVEGNGYSRIQFGVETLIASEVRLQYTGYGERY